MIQKPKAERQIRQLCALARQVCNANPDLDRPSLADLIKHQAARLRLSYTSDTVRRAMDRVEQGMRYRAAANAAPARVTEPPPPPVLPRSPEHVGPAQYRHGVVIRTSSESPSGQAPPPPPARPRSLAEIIQTALAQTAPFTAKGTSHVPQTQNAESQGRRVPVHPTGERHRRADVRAAS